MKHEVIRWLLTRILFHLKTTRPIKQFSTMGAFVTGGAVSPFTLDEMGER